MSVWGSRESNAAGANTDRNKVVVYDFNIHQMDDEWQAWVDEIHDGTYAKPDVLLLQDVEDVDYSDLADANGFNKCQEDQEPVVPGVRQLRDRMVAVLGSSYHYRISNQFTPGECENEVAVIFRGPFDFVRQQQGLGYGGAKCDADHSGAPWLVTKLKDSRWSDGSRTLSVASFKTPPSAPPNCPFRNTEAIHGILTSPDYGGDLLVMGTDSNSPDNDAAAAAENYQDGYLCWYRKTIEGLSGGNCGGDLRIVNGYRDPVQQELCRDWGDGSCFARFWTFRVEAGVTKRYDFIFTQKGGGAAPRVSNTGVMFKGIGQDNTCGAPEGEEGTCFSDHRAVRTFLDYRAKS